MELRYVFTSSHILRCMYSNGYSVPVEVVDMVDVLENFKSNLKMQGTSCNLALNLGIKKKPFLNSPTTINSSLVNLFSTKKSMRHDQTDFFISKISSTMQLRWYKQPIDDEEVLEKIEAGNINHSNDPIKIDDKTLDFIYISTFYRYEEVEYFLRQLKRTKLTYAVEIDVGVGNQILITYQQLFDFDHSYMILKCYKKEGLAFIKPF
ncbi:uncharacterized protein LOC100209047 [Hydra vulgaris]|uniref:uncharacterized protein LOC100209047 n=1 Tax=Hydra vulgaris TaxID=6087 RepID=UPI00019277CF|nr:uncharacterized protein LOC100209047 [Hydra vulgaris]XP_047131699.1 uncharacterized protein LOC100209047 [Hydra vulgaris]